MTKFLSLLFISVAATRGPPKAPKPTKSTKADKPADNRLDDCKRYFGTIEAEEGGKEIKTLLIPNPDSLNSYLRCKRDISIQPPEYKVTPVGIEQSTPGGDEWIAGCWWMPGCGSGCGAFCQQDHENKKNCLKDIGCSNKQHCRINRSSPCAEVIEPITTEEPEEVTTKKEEVIEPITTEEPEEVTTKKEEGNCNSCDKFNDWKPLKDCKRWTSGLDECTGQNSRSWNRYCEKSCCKLKNCGKKD